jgi:5-methylcytosine-specific restriction endonuclease McrA
MTRTATPRALVLNASYEPIGVVSGRRAVILALADKVDVLSESDATVSSADFEMAIPSVVRLRYYVKVPYKRTAPLSRRAVFARDGGACQYCGKAAESIDHVIPRSRGGEHTWDNVVACCRRCNTFKSDRLLKDCPLTLRSTPQAPTQYVWLKVAAGKVPAEWNQYIDRWAA